MLSSLVAFSIPGRREPLYGAKSVVPSGKCAQYIHSLPQFHLRHLQAPYVKEEVDVQDPLQYSLFW
jgi:hypothetical protein